MNISKKTIGHLTKCYSMAVLDLDGQDCFLVAAEKNDPCYLFDKAGTYLETVWDGPGGVMTMVQVPGKPGQFLATQKFYSPNDSKEASIVLARREAHGWRVDKLADAPFVHRFGIIDGWLLVCCLKSDHEYKEDWRSPGAVYAARLPENLSSPICLEPLMTGLLKNHGFSITEANGQTQAVVAAENGTFLFTPPAGAGDPWTIEQVSPVPSSDSVLLDLDGDGLPELGTISPFHGSAVTIWHLDPDGHYVPQWKLPLPEKDTEMVHATWAGELAGQPCWAVGWRKGTQQTVAITWNAKAGTYQYEVIDGQAGAANLMHFVNDRGQDVLVATNRERDEIAMYTIEKEEN